MQTKSRVTEDNKIGTPERRKNGILLNITFPGMGIEPTT